MHGFGMRVFGRRGVWVEKGLGFRDLPRRVSASWQQGVQLQKGTSQDKYLGPSTQGRSVFPLFGALGLLFLGCSWV